MNFLKMIKYIENYFDAASYEFHSEEIEERVKDTVSKLIRGNIVRHLTDPALEATRSIQSSKRRFFNLLLAVLPKSNFGQCIGATFNSH